MLLNKIMMFLFIIGLIMSTSFANKSWLNEQKISSDTIIVKSELNKYFRDRNVEGSIAIYDKNNNLWIVNDSEDINKGALPASTFKIMNLLIALETGAIKDENEIIKWVGETDTVFYGYRPEIYHDMTAKEAFEVSAVWVFIELAKRIGKDNFNKYLKESNYGNEVVSEEGYDFWLMGDLRITPVNQINFLRNVYDGNSPFSKRSVEILKRVMITEKTNEYVIRAKTGWVAPKGMNTGWWVGYVETEKGIYFFATRIFQDSKISDGKFLLYRKEITKLVLKELNIIPK